MKELRKSDHLYEVLKVQNLYGPVAQLVRAPPCHGGGHGFESRLGRFGILAQLGEHLPYKQRVTGSSPVGPIFKVKTQNEFCVVRRCGSIHDD